SGRSEFAGSRVGGLRWDAVDSVRGFPRETKRSKLPEEEVVSEENRQCFIGKFSSKEGQEITIATREDSLIVELEGEIHSLKVIDEDLLVIKETEKPIRFFFNEEKEAWAIFLGMRMLLRED